MEMHSLIFLSFVQQNQLKEIARTSKPSEALQKATENGGELEAIELQKLPRNI